MPNPLLDQCGALATDPPLVLGGDSNTIVHDFDCDTTVAGMQAHGYRAIGRRVLESIVDELLEGELHQPPIEEDRWELLVGIYHQSAIHHSWLHRGGNLPN